MWNIEKRKEKMTNEQIALQEAVKIAIASSSPRAWMREAEEILKWLKNKERE